MASKAMIESLNKQINNEISSSYLYLSMAAHCDANNFGGFANWLKLQAKEEMEHAMKFYKLINSLGGEVILKAIPQPETEFKSLLEITEKVLKHEKGVTAAINGLYEQALKENDYATQINLQWFINEQIEEEENASELVHQVKNVGDNYTSLMIIDAKLAKRQ
jgi:ferritin